MQTQWKVFSENDNLTKLVVDHNLFEKTTLYLNLQVIQVTNEANELVKMENPQSKYVIVINLKDLGKSFECLNLLSLFDFLLSVYSLLGFPKYEVQNIEELMKTKKN